MRTLFSALVVVAAAASGCANHDGHTTADSGNDRPAAKVVKIEMVDNKFEPIDLTARTGETITFRFTNSGTARHEALVGDSDAQEEHAREMMSSSTVAGDHDMGDMGGMHHDGASYAGMVEPGGRMDLTRTFDKTGEFIIGCHVPGHYESGMKATIEVT